MSLAKSMPPVKRPETYSKYLEKLINISNRCATKDAHLLKPDEVLRHKAANKAYMHALKLYKRYHNE